MNNVEIVKHLKTLIDCDQFVLTGSMALSYLGFKKPIKDIDIIAVNIKNIDLLKKLEEENPPYNKSQYQSKDIFRFVIDGICIDVFMQAKKVNTQIQTEDGILLAPINHIVEEKIKMNRPKDHVQLYSLSMEIFDTGVFKTFCKSI